MSTEVPDSTYYLEIEAHFAERRKTPFILSAKDWVLMKKWRETGIPLPVVIEAIDQVFARNEESGRKKVISSLSYCRHAVKELWEERRDLEIGSGEAVPEEDPAPALEVLAVKIAASELPVPVAEELGESVRGLAALRSVPKIEERLIEMEQELFARLDAGLSEQERADLRASITKALGDPSRLEEKTRARTEDANRRRLLREKFSLPRLTLFH